MSARRRRYRKTGMVRCLHCGWIDRKPERWSIHPARTHATKAIAKGLDIRMHIRCRVYRPDDCVLLDPSNP